MSLFSKDKSSSPVDAKGSQLDSMANFPDMAAAVGAAPSTTKAGAEEIARPSNRPSSRASRTPPSAPVPPAKTAEEIKKEELRKKALDVVGKELCSEIAEIPYEVWAFMASNPELRLTKEEATELADSYFLLAQAIDPDFSSPWMLGFTLMAKNVVLVAKRVKMEQLKKAEGIALETGAAILPDRKPQ